MNPLKIIEPRSGDFPIRHCLTISERGSSFLEDCMKTCIKCNVSKKASMFYKHSGTGRRRNVCIYCWSVQTVSNILKNKAKRKDYCKQYHLKNRDKINERHRKWKRNNKHKIKAQSAIYIGLEQGKINKPKNNKYSA